MSTFGVFIIEFLRADDFFDGEALSEILRLSLIPFEYAWVDNKEELNEAIEKFRKSRFRYLHISCHADQKGFEINGEDIPNEEIQELTKHALTNKRIFISACKGANRDLATRMIMNNNAYSLLGIPMNLPFDKSALFWPSFYHLINEKDTEKMQRENIVSIVTKCVELFGIPVNYYSRIRNNNHYIRRLKIRLGKPTENRRIKSIA